MLDILATAGETLSAPMILFFALGMAAALLRSDLTVPEPVAKALALFLMMAIGLKGGAALAESGLGGPALPAMGAGVLLSFLLPLLAFAWLRATTRLNRADSGAIAAHYGSISVVTFVTATAVLGDRGVILAGYMVAVMALMETPAIVTGLFLAKGGKARMDARFAHDVLLNGSVVLLIGAFAVGWIGGTPALDRLTPFIVDPFDGVLCLFLLDMGLVAGRRLREAGGLQINALVFAVVMPLLNALAAVGLSLAVGLGMDDATFLAVLAASASYIAVPAALRLALPEANPGIALTLSLAVTFPFNIAIGIPLYHALVQAVYGGA